MNWINNCTLGHSKCPRARKSALPTRVVELLDDGKLRVVSRDEGRTALPWTAGEALRRSQRRSTPSRTGPTASCTRTSRPANAPGCRYRYQRVRVSVHLDRLSLYPPRFGRRQDPRAAKNGRLLQARRHNHSRATKNLRLRLPPARPSLPETQRQQHWHNTVHELWYAAVHEYSYRALSFPEDKLPTISGLASEFRSLTSAHTSRGSGGATSSAGEVIRPDSARACATAEQ